ncbi:MAG: O-methyltransferase [Armatimonadetes bacterium]|nr:O-methyltransferase [Armatimonadota bacterium]
MDLFHPQMTAFLEALTPARDPVLQEMEERARQTRFPIIGPLVGQLFYLLTRLTGARRVFEMGSGYGYSTAWFARALRDNGGGEVYHVVWDEELSRQAKEYLGRLNLVPHVKFRVSEAVEELGRTDGPFDIVFNDIEKKAYPDSLAVIKPRLSRGGLLLIDNMFRSGRTFDPQVKEEGTEAVRRAARMLYDDPDFVTTVIPLRDGVLMAWRK